MPASDPIFGACRCRARSLWRKQVSTGSGTLVTAFRAAAGTTPRCAVLCMQIAGPRGRFADGSPTCAIVGVPRQTRRLHVWVVGRPDGRVWTDRVEGPQRRWPAISSKAEVILGIGSSSCRAQEKAGGEQSDHARAQGSHGCFVRGATVDQLNCAR